MYTYLHEELLAATQERGPLKIAIAGTGFIAGGILNQMDNSREELFFPSVVIYHTKESFVKMHSNYGAKYSYAFCESKDDIENAAKNKEIAAVKDIDLALLADIDIVVDFTGHVEFGAELAYKCIKAGIDFCASPEMDVAVGAYLNQMAESKGVVYSGFTGDEPGEIANLVSYVKLMGFEITAAGKFKKFLDKYANPESVKPWAEKFKQSALKISSFADGTKMNIEMAITANATGLVPDVAGMNCVDGTFDTVVDLMRPKSEGGVLNQTGVIEIIKGVEPSGGVFVVGKNDNPKAMSDLKYLKMGDGPYYLFYKAYHLCAFEMLIGIAKNVLLKSSVIKPLPKENVCVAIYAKKDLAKGEVIDEIGGFAFYGLIEKKKSLNNSNYLPVSAAPGCVLKHDLKKDELITIEDVEYNAESYLWKLLNKEIS